MNFVSAITLVSKIANVIYLYIVTLNMQKLNFATRVTVLEIPKVSSDRNVSGAALQNRMQIQAEINRYRVNLNRKEFEKTKAEKDVLKLRKADPACKLQGTVMMPFNNRG